MPKLDLATIPDQTGSRYPSPFDAPCKNRSWKRLGDAGGLTQFGVNLVRIPPGSWSSQRHWHSHEDELAYVISGELVLVTDAGDAILRAGECATFKGGVPDGHCFQNRSHAEAVLLVVGSRSDEDHGEYPDVDMKFGAGRYSGNGRFTRKDGTPY